MQTVEDVAPRGGDRWAIIYRRGVLTRLKDVFFFILFLLVGLLSAAVTLGIGWLWLSPETLPRFSRAALADFRSPYAAVIYLPLGLLFGYSGIVYAARQALDWVLPAASYSGGVKKEVRYFRRPSYYIDCEARRVEVPERVFKRLYDSQPITATFYPRTRNLLSLSVRRA